MIKNQLKAGAVLSYLTLGLNLLIPLAYTPFLLRLIGQSEYGLYNLSASIVNYLALMNFGFGSAYMRYYSKFRVEGNREKIASLNGMFLIIFCAIGVVAILAGSVIAINSDTILGAKFTGQELSTSKILIFILVVNLAVTFPNIVFNTYVTANERFVFLNILKLIQIIVTPIFVLPVLYMGFRSVGLAITTLGINIAIELATAIYADNKLNIKFHFRNFDFKLMKEMTLFSTFVFINMVSSQISWNVDKLILGRFHGTISVAVYALAAQINSQYLSIGTTISHLFVPRVHRLVAEDDSSVNLNELFIKIGRIQFMVLSLISIGFVFLGKVFILAWAGVEYADSYVIILLLILPATLPLTQNIGIEIQRAKNMHSFSTWVYLFFAIVNLLISIPLAKKFEGIGSAIGTSIALILGNLLVMNWYYHKRVGLNIIYYWKQIIKIFPGLFIPITFLVVVTNSLDISILVNFFLVAVTYLIIFVVSIWCFGMNQFEKELFSKPINQIVGRFNKTNQIKL